ncbi:integrase family protein [Maricaulis maris]|jgi:integrase|uniref:tyrosine-type recombinase/integrase n=1 Tax=Maricaulis maris TaxID=74318 RepID=UPI0026EFA7BC|nr:integrase family protein [Maricaulis maris]
MAAVKITSRFVADIPAVETGQVLYRDAVLRGFGVRVGSRSKVYFAEGSVQRRSRRVTIGRADVISADQARKQAAQILAKMARGIDPSLERKKADERSLSLERAFEGFFASRPHLSQVTVASYRRTYRLYLAAWRKRPIVDISRAMVLSRHRLIAEKHGEVTANNAMRHLRSVYNFTAAASDDFPSNPVQILTQGRSWFKEKRRSGLIRSEDLPKWWKAVHSETPAGRDILVLAIMTGMRRSEILGLQWANIDLAAARLEIPVTKNGDPLELPLSDFLVKLLKARKKTSRQSAWVFPGRGGRGHQTETKRLIERVRFASGVDFTLHDLRRTFITIAEGLDVPYYALKRLLNHRISGDVTSGYIFSTADRLRGPMEKVSAAILAAAQV